jgi:hypothetical protein
VRVNGVVGFTVTANTTEQVAWYSIHGTAPRGKFPFKAGDLIQFRVTTNCSAETFLALAEVQFDT